MKVKNTSLRLYHVGGVSIAPGQIAEIDDKFKSAISDDLVEVAEDKPRKSKAAKADIADDVETEKDAE